jgi:hypothetical protein
MAEDLTVRRKKYSKRKKSGYCPRCGVKLSKRETHIYCEDCREYFRDYNRETADKINKKRRTIYKQRIKSNLCPRCGVKLGKKYEKTLCPKCLGKNVPKGRG